MAEINLPFGYKRTTNTALDTYYLNNGIPYTSEDQANSLININVRHIGQLVNINNEDYWYKNGKADINLVKYLDISTVLTENIPVSNPDLGLILPFTFLQGDDFTTTIKKLVQKTFVPSITGPSFSMDNNLGFREVGSTDTFTITFNFNRGVILGKTVSGVWQPGATQDFRAGSATTYSYYTYSGTSNSTTFSTGAVQLGYNTYTGTITYSQGPQAIDSLGTNFSTPLSGSISPTQSTSFEGVYPTFGTTINITTATKQPLFSQISGNFVQVNLVAETGGNKQFIELESQFLTTRPLTQIQYFNTVSGLFDTTNKLSDFTITTVTNVVQTISKSYKRYTYIGSDRANILIRLIF